MAYAFLLIIADLGEKVDAIRGYVDQNELICYWFYFNNGVIVKIIMSVEFVFRGENEPSNFRILNVVREVIKENKGNRWCVEKVDVFTRDLGGIETTSLTLRTGEHCIEDPDHMTKTVRNAVEEVIYETEEDIIVVEQPMTGPRNRWTDQDRWEYDNGPQAPCVAMPAIRKFLKIIETQQEGLN